MTASRLLSAASGRDDRSSHVCANIGKLAVAGVVVFALLQAVRPAIPARQAAAEVQAPSAVINSLIRTAIVATRTNGGLHGSIKSSPAYWLVRYDILTAREHLNFFNIRRKACRCARKRRFTRL